MISIAIEGLACVGKTTLCELLAQQLPGKLVPEVLKFANKIESDYRSNYYESDLSKSQILKDQLESDPPILLDRYYISTLAHTIAYEILGGKKLSEAMVLSKLSEEYLSLLKQPTLWIYLRENPKISFCRYSNLRVQDENSLWSNLDGTMLLGRIYDQIFEILSIQPPNVHLAILPSSPPNQLVQDVLKIIQRLIIFADDPS